MDTLNTRNELQKVLAEHFEVLHTMGRYCTHCKWGRPRGRLGDTTEIPRLSSLWDFHDRDCPVAYIMELCDLRNSPFPSEELRREEEAEYHRKIEDERRIAAKLDGVWFGEVQLPYATKLSPTKSGKGHQEFAVAFSIPFHVWCNISPRAKPMIAGGLVVGDARVIEMYISGEVSVVFELTSLVSTVNLGHIDALLGETPSE